MTTPERHLAWFLRATALMFMAAAPAIIMPTAWMRGIAEMYELELPAGPLVEYLTRSVSAVYVMMGATYWFLAGDVRRYLPFLRFTVPCTVVFDLTVIALDFWIPMPALWTMGEAVAIFGWTAALWWLVRRVEGMTPAHAFGAAAKQEVYGQ